MFDVRAIDFKGRRVASPTGIFYGFDEVELLQFTGFRDKNGEEVYKGYVLKYVHSKPKRGKAKVSYLEVYWNEKKGQWWMRGYQTASIWGGAERHEVVGNIYENPEFLK
jgi:uncharacterized phage protein (TIGR01671 family)